MYDEPTATKFTYEAVARTSGTVVIYFPSGEKQEFKDCKDVNEITVDGEKLIVFTQGDNRFVFKKSQLAGWSLPLLPR